MTSERLDLIVLGATGFTGKYVVKCLVNLNKELEYANISWGISGRSKEKLKNIILELERNGTDTSKLPVIECDVNDENAIRSMAQQAKVVLNCTGPNTVLSESVVRICIESKTHYVDISAELMQMLTIYRKYDDAAKNANVLVVPGCGFATIPAITALNFLENNFKGTLNTVRCYVDFAFPKKAYIPVNNTLIHYGTWASLVHELKNFRPYQELKKETFTEPLCDDDPPEIKKSFFHRHKGRIWFPYPGPDHDVIEVSERYLKETKQKRPYHVKLYTTMPYTILLFFVVPIFMLYYYASYLKCFRNLLWKYPRFFTAGLISHKGPSEKMMDSTKWSFTLIGKGWSDDNFNSAPNKSMTVRVSGSDPGYKTTAIAMVLSAISILKEAHTVPKAGILGTGAAFDSTQLLERLIKDGSYKYEIVEEKK